VVRSRPDIDARLRAVRLSALDAAERGRLLGIYERTVYNPAFPNAEIRENPAYWLGLLGASPYPPSPQPRIEVILLMAEGDKVAGGATVELYRAADCGLLTYLSVAADRRGQGLGRRLIGEARAALSHMAGGERLLFAETERLEDAANTAEREATIVRLVQLAGLGGRLVDYDYWMPPLRPGLPAHRLHLILFGCDAAIPAATVGALMAELAAALGADLGAEEETRRMMTWLAGQQSLAVRPLPVANEPRPK
jgi:GNAT superfamily N-acetyltransferase